MSSGVESGELRQAVVEACDLLDAGESLKAHSILTYALRSPPESIDDKDLAISGLNKDWNRLREALQDIANGGNAVYSDWPSVGPLTREEMAARARAALEFSATEQQP